MFLNKICRTGTLGSPRENPIMICAKLTCLEQLTKYYIQRDGRVRWDQPRKYCRKHRVTKPGSLHHSWRGDDVNYTQLHIWDQNWIKHMCVNKRAVKDNSRYPFGSCSLSTTTVSPSITNFSSGFVRLESKSYEARSKLSNVSVTFLHCFNGLERSI
jgi:hypothetical protein